MQQRIIPILLFCLAATALFGQQEQQYTQFMYQKLTLNPASAGTKGVPELNLSYRNQWMGFEGAPKTIGLGYQTTWLQKKVGLGLNVVRRTIGITDRLTLDGAYAYRVRMSRGMLGVGVQASVRHFRNNYLDSRLKGTQAIADDEAIPKETMSKVVPNFGFGLYYNTQRAYVGFSIPRLVSNNIDFAQAGGVLSKEVPHFYLMGGYKIRLADGFELEPQVLFKYVKNAPLDGDVNATLTIQEKFLTGLTYRLGGGEVSSAGESIDVMAGFQANPKLFFGLSYDIGLTKLRKYHNGSIEAVARYYFAEPSETSGLVNPLDE